jgi:hypothetical protein
MFRLARAKPRRCKYVEGFGENARRCENNVDPDRGNGATHCWEHLWHEKLHADKHPGKVSGE